MHRALVIACLCLLGCLAGAIPAAFAQGSITVDPAFRALTPPPRPQPDLAPRPLELPAGTPSPGLLGLGPNIQIAPTTLDSLDAQDPHAWLRGQEPSPFRTGEALETPVAADRLGATLTFPF
jgi:hypothetical protein